MSEPAPAAAVVATAPGGVRHTVPEWFPPWARQLAEMYFSGTTCMFLLHGNVRDLVGVPVDGGYEYGSLAEFLAGQVFGSWDIVANYDLARGMRGFAPRNPQRLQTMARELARLLGDPSTWPRDPDTLLPTIDRLIERNLLEEDPQRRRSLGFIFDYAQYLAPAGDLGSLTRGQGTTLVRFLSWAQNPYIKRVNTAFCLVADKLAEVNDRLISSPHVATVEIPLPDAAERKRFCEWLAKANSVATVPAAAAATTGASSPSAVSLTTEQLVELSNGMSLNSLNVLLSQSKAGGRATGSAEFKQLKKSLIERQCQGLLEFVEPKHTLDLVVGQDAAKQRLRQDADLILQGRLDAAPMGYLLSGPVGTGKTFLAECYAGSIGIPCVKLRNFRSKYVGETEGNLEQVLGVLRSLGPAVVMIDEADAALGNRESGGDSGTSSRVFAMIASQMGDTRYRGQIIWMLMTSRPELLPIDLKRQGRAEVHIPLFYPQGEDELRAMFIAMAKKNKSPLKPEAIPKIKADRFLSGSDIESIVLAAKRRMLVAGRTEISTEDLSESFNEFIPSAQGLEKEMQELASVLECTQLSFLPPDWRAKVTEPNGRAALQQRLVELKQLLAD